MRSSRSLPGDRGCEVWVGMGEALGRCYGHVFCFHGHSIVICIYTPSTRIYILYIYIIYYIYVAYCNACYVR